MALEHALAAQWVVHTYGGEDALIGSMSRLHRNVVQTMRDGGVVIPQRLQADLNHPVGEPQLKIEAVADRFDGGTKSIYGLYRQLTGAVHVSLATLTAYIEWRGEDQPLALKLAAKPDSDPDQLLALGWSPVLALSAIERLRSGQPYLAKIRDIASAHELVPDLGPLDAQPDLQQPPSSPTSGSRSEAPLRGNTVVIRSTAVAGRRVAPGLKSTCWSLPPTIWGLQPARRRRHQWPE